MVRFFLGLMRFAATHLGFLLSCFAAAAFITFILFLGRDIGWLQDDVIARFGAFGFCIAVWLSIIQLAYIPFLLLLIVMEWARLKTLMANLYAGGLCATAILVLVPEITKGDVLPYEGHNIWLSCIASGFVAGFCYWVLAGHRAGRWLGPAKQAV